MEDRIPGDCSTTIRRVVRKVSLYVLKVTPSRGCSFQTSRLVYDNIPEVKEVAFILITNKKDRGKAKVSSSSPTNSRNKISLVSRAPPISRIVTASIASKLATTCSFSAAATTILSKLAQPQSAPLPVSLTSKPKPKIKLFAQATKANSFTQQILRFTSTSSHEDFLQLFQLKKAFPNLLQATIISIH